ncbi:MAG: hypothetical protein U0K57_03480 [Lachnospiraceae bacterium]|nr:hypothetical protein [Lachnospiraceae bacterium]
MRRITAKHMILFFFAVFSISFLSFGRTEAAAKKIYTPRHEINAAADKIINRATTPDMTKEQKLKAVYVYLVKNMHYSHSAGPVRVKVSKQDKKRARQELKQLKSVNALSVSTKFRRRYRNVLTLQGTCYDMSAVYCVVANHLGYKAGLDSGRYVRGNGSTCEHWWNYVTINGHRRYFDVQAANASWKSHHNQKAIFAFYNKSKGERVWRKHHRG